MPTSVVTGGAGFLGSHLCDALMGRGHRVICVDNFDTGSLQNIAHLREGDNFRFMHVDITSHYEIDEPVDFVYHMASPASPIGSRGVYDEAKRYAEALTMAYYRQQGVDTAIVRIFNTYGPRMRPNDGRAIPTFMSQALADKPLTVFGDGSQTRSFCYVDDLIRGLIALVESGVHDPVNIGNPNEMTLLDMAKTVVEMTESRSEIVFEALPVDDPQVRQPEITRARQLLGWEPEIDLREGLAKTIEHASANLTRL